VARKPRTPNPPRPVQAPKRREGAKRSSSSSWKSWKLLGIAAAVVAIGVGVGLGIGLSGSSGSSGGSGGRGSTVDFAALRDLQGGPPPWDSGASFLEERLAGVHLSLLGQEGQVLHIHQHLDLWVNGKRVRVPADIGITANLTAITSVHTHDTTGVIHVESPVQRDYTLGQFFGEWGVWLSANRIGKYTGKVRWWVNGKERRGNPAGLILQAHQEIVIAVGKRPFSIPSTYAWNGL
jgi:hypothetical protein